MIQLPHHALKVHAAMVAQWEVPAMLFVVHTEIEWVDQVIKHRSLRNTKHNVRLPLPLERHCPYQALRENQLYLDCRTSHSGRSGISPR